MLVPVLICDAFSRLSASCEFYSLMDQSIACLHAIRESNKPHGLSELLPFTVKHVPVLRYCCLLVNALDGVPAVPLHSLPQLDITCKKVLNWHDHHNHQHLRFNDRFL